MNKKKRRYAFIAGGLALLISWTLTADIETNNVLSLEECIALAIQNNPGPASQLYDVAGAKAQVDEEKGNRLPMILGTANYTRFSENILPGNENREYGFSIQVRRPLFRGGGLDASVSNATFNWKAAGYRYESRLQDLILEVNDAYLNHLKNKRLLEVSERALKQAETYLEAARERFRLGVARMADTLKAEVEVSDAELNIINAQNALLTSRARLNKTMGLPVSEFTRVRDLLEEENITYNQPEVEALIREAETHLPELKEMNMNIRAQESVVKIANSEYWPSVNAGVSYEWNGNTVSNRHGSFNVGISVDILIFNGFSRRARVNRQRARLHLLNKKKEELRQDVSLAVWVDYLKVKEMKERIINSRKHLKNAGENLRIAEGEYREGVNSMLELLDARNTSVRAEKTYINALAEYRMAQAKLERSIGVIKNTTPVVGGK